MMIVFIKGNDLELSCKLSAEELRALVEINKSKQTHIQVSVYLGVRVGYVPLDDLDMSKSYETKEQLLLEL